MIWRARKGSLDTMDLIELDQLPCRVRLARNKRARRLTLRMDPTGPDAILTLPPRVPIREAESFLLRHAKWLEKASERQPEFVVVGAGTRLPVHGRIVQICVEAGRRAPPRLIGDELILKGDRAIGPRIAAWLKQEARARLAERAHHHAEALGREITALSLRDTRSRWGSCSSTGALSFSWRLAMSPPAVQDYVAAHEAAHLVEMNHSDRFWAVVERRVPDWKTHRNWLRSEGRHLHAYRFNGD